ncbi:MAG TPA: nucleotidyltransferase domain-containing protein [Ktedonobacteraceae bacterium]|jgi:predicted nucleotidyltransferase|nr:nucleotidyltransferase domain-containing protein [Ktedonobacteraceae bacterium]
MQHEPLLQQIVDYLQPVQGLRAIVLGGSYASGTARPDSDLDIGLYYYENQPLAIGRIRSIAATLNDTLNPVVTELGGWGTWVNGGAWLSIGGQRLDFLYRNIDFVAATLDECNRGMIHSDYWQQPAYGFHSFMYCTETAICRPLSDPDHIIDDLKTKVVRYSPQLKQTIIRTFLWNARFTLDNTYKPAARGEVYLVTGCLARTMHCLVQVLYALNETYYLSEKRLEADVHAFSIQPALFLERMYALLGVTGTTSVQLQESLMRAEALYNEFAILVK